MVDQEENTYRVPFLKRISLLFKRFGKDLFGLLLIAIAAITMLGYLSLTSGKLVDQWVELINKAFGWSIYFLVFIVLYIGVVIVFRHLERFPKMDYAFILKLEFQLFLLAALLSAIGGYSVDRASNGVDGGILGWGIARIFSNLIGEFSTYILLYLLNLISFLALFKVGKKITRFFDSYLTDFLSGNNKGDVGVNTHLSGSAINAQFDGGGESRDSVDSRKKIPQTVFELPPLDILLDNPSTMTDEPYIHAKAVQIEKTLEEFSVPTRVAGYRVGPTIIQYALEPGFVEKVNDAGNIEKKKVRVSQIVGLKKDIALALSVDRLRIEAPIPGHAFVGIEIPNTNSVLVRLKSILRSDAFKRLGSSLSLALGLDVSGNPIIADLARMPHLLVAGTTGSGKSVCITSVIACLAMNNTPDQLKLAILDPKMVELVRFNGLPHLMGRVETQLDRMLAVLAWAIKEMEDRYKQLEQINARDLDVYNEKMRRRGKDILPKVVIVIDELADLMLTEPEKTESYLVRLAQMARAVGIHLVVATQRPSTDIITGLIKANFPARISFMMASSIDSRVILDTNGAETLMGKGDLLFLDPETAGIKRAQGVLVDDREIENIINYWQAKDTQERSILDTLPPWENLVESQISPEDTLLMDAIKLVREDGYASTSRLQRKLRIGFPRAARLMDELEEQGVVGPQESGGKVREVLPTEEFFDEADNDMYEG